MARKESGLKVVEPQPISDERTPLLDEQNGQPREESELEAQAEQEQREYDANSVPIADEPSTRKLVMTMSSLWLSTFFAALGTTCSASPYLTTYADSMILRRCHDHSHPLRPNKCYIQLLHALLMACFRLPDR